MATFVVPVPLEALRAGTTRESPRPDTDHVRVLGFLKSHAALAWRAGEIAEVLGAGGSSVGAALRRLHGRGLVHTKGGYWYSTDEREGSQLAAAVTATRALNERSGTENPGAWPDVEQD